MVADRRTRRAAARANGTKAAVELREVLIGKAASQRINAIFAEARRLEATAKGMVNIVLEQEGCEIDERSDGLVWNVEDDDKRPGCLVARLGPKRVGPPVLTMQAMKIPADVAAAIAKDAKPN